MALATLSDIKTLAGISGTAEDSKLTLILNGVSAMIESYCARKFARGDYVETLSPSGRQYLIVKNWPVNSVASIVQNGYTLNPALTPIPDYIVQPYGKSGLIFRQIGWNGTWLYDGILVDQIVTGSKEIVVTYNAGYYLPGDSGYVIGADDSLPLDLQLVCQEMVLETYLRSKRQSFDGLSGLTEGGLSYQWGGRREIVNPNNSSGIQQEYAGILNKYRRLVFES